jgi:hypothetical protein
MGQVKVRISPDGSEVKVEVNGIAGESCTDLTAALEKSIYGSSTIEQNFTDEYYQEPDIGVESSI